MPTRLECKRSRAALAALLLLLALGGTACSTAQGPDPGQGANEAIFGFNEGVDRYLLEPVAKGWDFVFPEIVQTGIRNFFDNLLMIRSFLNDGLQGEPLRAAQDLGRFFTNSTIGVVGFVDVASPLGIPHNQEDFGQTLGVWGLSSGAYVMIPLLGPSTVRDTVALPLDLALNPTWLLPGLGIVDIVNRRAYYLEEVAENRETALDYYVFVRNAYLQNRERNVLNGEDEDAGEEGDDFYELPEDDEDDDLE